MKDYVKIDGKNFVNPLSERLEAALDKAMFNQKDLTPEEIRLLAAAAYDYQRFTWYRKNSGFSGTKIKELVPKIKEAAQKELGDYVLGDLIEKNSQGATRNFRVDVSYKVEVRVKVVAESEEKAREIIKDAVATQMTIPYEEAELLFGNITDIQIEI